MTTIITGVVLYYIGTDQVKGFAVTLILGIVTSMFTAIFVSRLIFDIAERQGWIKQIRMMKLMSTPNFDFLGERMAGDRRLSLVLIAIGMVAVYIRGQQMLDIDFTGGSSVTFVLNPDDKMDVRASPRTRWKRPTRGQEPGGRAAWHVRHPLFRRHQRAVGREVKQIIRRHLRRQAADVRRRRSARSNRFREGTFPASKAR